MFDIHALTAIWPDSLASIRKGSLNSDGQQFLQYQRNEQSPQLIEHESRKIDDISTDLISVNIFYYPKTWQQDQIQVLQLRT